MNTARISQSLPWIRWMTAIAIASVAVALVVCLLAGPRVPIAIIQALGVLTLALSAYAWVLYLPPVSAVISLLVLGGAQWAWAARQPGGARWDLTAFAIIIGVAAAERRRRQTRFKRMRQLLDDLREEQTVKEQAIAAAHQVSQGLQKKLHRYTQLQMIAAELSNMTDLTAISQLVVTHAFALIGKSDACLLFLLDKERQELSLFASKRRESVSAIRAKHGDQFDRHVLRTQRALLVNDVRRDFRFPATGSVAASHQRPISSVVASPLVINQSPEGVLRLDSSQPGAYTQDDLRFLDILLDLVSAAVTNAKLFAQTQRLAIADGLTGLMLRRPFMEQLSRELTRSARSREPVSVLMLDVDEFKKYNDSFGHTAGDVVLKGVADVLRAAMPAGGAVARYGGEEFSVLLPRLSRHEAGDLAEKLRRLVEEQVRGGRPSPRGPSDGRRVTVSIGVAAFPDDAQVELELLRVADQRLYQAKRSGRNLVVSS